MNRRAAVCIIGSELVRGIITDAHGKLIASDLTRIGYDVTEILIVPDDGSIRPQLERLVHSTDLIITTGGLGPTSDDITRDVIAEVFKVALVVDEPAKAHLVSQVGEHLNRSNMRQVLIPEGFTVLPNDHGTAPGFCRPGCFYALPGPPREMAPMWAQQVMPALRAGLGLVGEEQRLEVSALLVPESLLEEACSRAVSEIAAEGGISLEAMPHWGTRVQPYRISLYLQGSTGELRSAVLERLRSLIGACRLPEGDVEAVSQLSGLLKERGLTIAAAESCTGGLTGSLLTEAPGSSAYFWGSFVTYDNRAKMRMLSVPASTLEEYGAVSSQTAAAMAEGALAASGTDASFSITGIAGPEGGSDGKPVGTVWFGFSSPGRPTQTVSCWFKPYSRASVRRRAAVCALLLLEQYIKGYKLLDIVGQWQYI